MLHLQIHHIDPALRNLLWDNIDKKWYVIRKVSESRLMLAAISLITRVVAFFHSLTLEAQRVMIFADGG